MSFYTNPKQKISEYLLGKYLVIYRITPHNIEVIRAFHSSQSVKKIKTARSVKIKKGMSPLSL